MQDPSEVAIEKKKGGEQETWRGEGGRRSFFLHVGYQSRSQIGIQEKMTIPWEPNVDVRLTVEVPFPSPEA